MDGTNLAFPIRHSTLSDAPHVLNVVRNPIAMGRELLRVCRPGGRVVFLNHFEGIPETTNLTNAVAGRLAAAFSVNWRLNVNEFLHELGAQAVEVESVNVPRLSSIRPLFEGIEFRFSKRRIPVTDDRRELSDDRRDDDGRGLSAADRAASASRTARREPVARGRDEGAPRSTLTAGR